MLRSSLRIIVLVGIVLFAGNRSARAAVVGTATIATTQTSAPYTYSLTLNNTGSLPIDTFWFAWLDNPDTNLMTSAPSNVHDPVGWFGLTSHNGTSDGYGLEYYAFTSGLAPGQSLTGFQFTSSESPAQLEQLVAIPGLGRSLPGTTTFLYSGGAFSANVAEITTTVLPEPSALVLAAGAGIGMSGAWLVRRRARRAAT